MGRSIETPPLTRGRHDQGHAVRERHGNTPAYAGKTSPLSTTCVCVRKHPRLRGEDAGNGPCRGQFFRNTPAYAGKTSSSARRRGSTWKHPRLRGEDTQKEKPAEKSTGNTPAYAGKTSKYAHGDDFLGNTPAYAGKTATFCTKTNLTIQNTLLLTDLSVFH